MKKRRVMALILAMTFIFSNVCALANTSSELAAQDSRTDIEALDSGYMAEPDSFSEDYAAYLMSKDETQWAQGLESSLWVDYMVKWRKAVPYDELAEDYVYARPDMRGRAATIPLSSVPLGAKIVDPVTKWGGEPMVWIKIADKVWGPERIGGVKTTSYSQISYGMQWGTTKYYGTGSGGGTKDAQLPGAGYYMSEKTIATLPHNTSPMAAPWSDTMLDQWLNTSARNTYFSMNFYDAALSRDLKGFMVPALTHARICGQNDSQGRQDYWAEHKAKLVGMPIVNSGSVADGYSPGYFSNWVASNPLVIRGPGKYSYHPSASASGTQFVLSGNVELSFVRNFSESIHTNSGRWNKHWISTETSWGILGGTGAEYMYTSSSGDTSWRPLGSQNLLSEYPVIDNLPMRVQPVIALVDTAQVLATPDANGVYTLVTSEYCDKPVLIETADTALGTILTAYSANAAGLTLYNGSTPVHSVAGTSLVYKVNAAGTYRATATKASFRIDSDTVTITNIASARPAVSISYQDAAQAWAGSVQAFFSVTEVANGGSLKPGASVTVTGPGGGVAAAHTGNGNFSFTATQNGTYTVSASIGGQSASASTSVSKIDVTAPAAPSISKFPAAAWHSDNVIVTLAGGSDAGSGVKGYQYRVDGGAWTDGASVSVGSTATVYGRTVDNVGRVSGEVSIAVSISRTAPNGFVTASSTDWTNSGVTLTLTGADTGGSGVKRVRPVGGSWVNGSSCTQTATANGTYHFEVENNAGSVGTVSKAVSNIDTGAPAIGDITFTRVPGSLRSVFFGRELEISLQAADTASGVARMEYQLIEEGASTNPAGWLLYRDDMRPRIKHSFTGALAVRATDNAGNLSPVKTADIVIEDTPPTASHMLTPDGPTNGSVTISVTATDTSGIASIALPDGTTVQDGSAQYTVLENGMYTFFVTDRCGNTLDYKATVNSFEDTPPTASHMLTPDGPTNGSVTISVTATDTSGIASIALPDGTAVQDGSAQYTVLENGMYTFFVTDRCGNTLDYTVPVSSIDKAAPAAAHTLTPNGWTNSDVAISVTGEDAGGIAQITLPDGTTTAQNPAAYTATANGAYTFTVQDRAGNTLFYEAEVTQIDRTPPLVTEFSLVAVEDNFFVRGMRGMLPDMFREKAELRLEAEDAGAGVARMEYQVVKDSGAPADDGWKPYRTGTRIAEDASIIVYARAVDAAGNVSPMMSRSVIIAASGPVGLHTLTPDTWAKDEVTITVEAVDALSGVASITSPDGTVSDGATARYTVHSNGQYTFQLQNNAGIVTAYTVAVANIDADIPTPPKLDPPTNPDSIELPWVHEPETLRVFGSSTSGVAKYEYSVTQLWPRPEEKSRAAQSEMWNECDGSITVKAEGVHSVIVRTVSTAGAASPLSEYTVKNDYTPPTAEVVTSGKSIRITAGDELSGVGRIVCAHGELEGGEVLCPMSASGIHHYDVYDAAGNVTPLDVDFTYRSSSGPWYPGGEPVQPEDNAQEPDKLPVDDDIAEETVPTNPAPDIPAQEQPAGNENESGGASISHKTRFPSEFTGNELPRTPRYDTSNWLRTMHDNPVLYASICFLLLLLSLLMMLYAIKKDRERKKQRRQQANT